eukprot:g2470.t1
MLRYSLPALALFLPAICAAAPANAPADFDCAMRNLAMEFAIKIQPKITKVQLQDLADALNGAAEAQCHNITVPADFVEHRAPPIAQTATSEDAKTVFVSPSGDDSAAGTLTAPMKTIKAAVAKVRGVKGSAVVLRKGTYMEGESIILTSADSGLTLTNYQDEEAIISGGEKIDITEWKPYKVSQLADEEPARNCSMVEDPIASVRGGLDYTKKDLNSTDIKDCIAMCCADVRCQAVSFNVKDSKTGKVAGCANSKVACCMLKSGVPELKPNKYGPTVRTAFNVNAPKPKPTPPPTPTPTPAPLKPNIYVADVDFGTKLTGLRIAGRRCTRARYPNADPETMGMHTNPTGWVMGATEWLPPKISYKTNPPVEVIVNDSRWSRHDSTGNELYYQAGINGSCMDLTPAYGYWCSAHPARTPSGSLTHRFPSGLNYKSHGVLPKAPYKSPEGAIVHSCRGGANCWFTWMFEVDSQATENGTLSWTKGGFQGAEGSDAGGVWYIENLLEELDYPNEWWYDEAEKKLYYFQNVSSHAAKAPPTEGWVGTSVKVLLNVSGTKETPVTGVTVKGITFRDAAPTFMDPHGMPSAGDWCLQRSGAIFLEGTEGVTIEGCKVIRCDGNGAFLSGYNRNASIVGSEFSFIGDTAIAQWGFTDSLPASEGGAAVALFYNGPRAHINFNDQFGGGNRITNNLVLNSCRETADHGDGGGGVPILHSMDPAATAAWRAMHENDVAIQLHPDLVHVRDPNSSLLNQSLVSAIIDPARQQLRHMRAAAAAAEAAEEAAEAAKRAERARALGLSPPPELPLLASGGMGMQMQMQMPTLAHQPLLTGAADGHGHGQPMPMALPMPMQMISVPFAAPQARAHDPVSTAVRTKELLWQARPTAPRMVYFFAQHAVQEYLCSLELMERMVEGPKQAGGSEDQVMDELDEMMRPGGTHF